LALFLCRLALYALMWTGARHGVIGGMRVCAGYNMKNRDAYIY